MKKILLYSLMGLMFSSFLPFCQSAEDEWISLFNGKDLTGWKAVHDVKFDVNEGNLCLVTGMGWFRTEEQFSDFVLEVEVKALKDEDYDSGIFFRAGLEGKPWPKVGWQVNLRYDAYGTLVQGYRPVEKPEIEKIKVGQWVKLRLTAKGETAKLEINDKKVWEVDIIQPETGYIGIQAENKSFEFRNFRVKKIK